MINNVEIFKDGQILDLSRVKLTTMPTEKNLDVLLNYLRDAMLYVPVENQYEDNKKLWIMSDIPEDVEKIVYTEKSKDEFK